MLKSLYMAILCKARTECMRFWQSNSNRRVKTSRASWGKLRTSTGRNSLLLKIDSGAKDSTLFCSLKALSTLSLDCKCEGNLIVINCRISGLCVENKTRERKLFSIYFINYNTITNYNGSAI